MKNIGLVLLVSLFILTGCATAKNDVSKKKVEVTKKHITQQECEKYLGKNNFDFIAEVYNSKEAAMLKCKEDMLSK